jgi:hypothetical protein
MAILHDKLSVPLSNEIALYWFQVLAMYPLLFQEWPPALNSFLNLLSLLNFEVGYFGIGCDFQNSFIQLMFMKFSLPHIVWLCMIIIELISSKGKPTKNRMYSIFANCIYLAVFFSMQIFSSMFQIVNCVVREDLEGNYWLKAEPRIQCYTSQWNVVVAFDGVLVFYFVLIPAFISRQCIQAGKS